MKLFFCLSIGFVLSLGSLYSQSDPVHPFPHPIKSKLKERTGETQRWPIYEKADMMNLIGRLHGGDSVLVDGWAAWNYYIKTKNIKGYVSWKAIPEAYPLDSISRILEEVSPKEEISYTPPISKDTAHAFFSLNTSKNTVFSGECVTVSLEFNVYDDNRLPMQFFDLGLQLKGILAKMPANSWSQSFDIVNIEGASIRNGMTTYLIYKGNYCAMPTAKSLYFPALELKISQVNKAKQVEKILSFKTHPKQVKTLAFPDQKTLGIRNMVGQFKLTDSFSSQTANLKSTVLYEVKVEGRGLLLPLEPPKFNIENSEIQIQDVIHKDTIINDDIFSTKKFIYAIRFLKAGVIDMKDRVHFIFFNPATSQLSNLTSSAKITINQSVDTTPIAFPLPKRNIIAIDVSESMMIEDYSPNRLNFIKDQLSRFILVRKQCDIGVVVFAGDSKNFVTSSGDSCYSVKQVSGINFNLINEKGTDIAGVIMKVKDMTVSLTGEKKLIIIGDGDNTTGHTTISTAALFAKQNNIKVYTIGVGHTGEVSFRRDYYERPMLVNNTFQDSDLKLVSSVTGGKYYWAQDEKSFADALRDIFK